MVESNFNFARPCDIQVQRGDVRTTMKLYLSFLVILLMADACWSSHCRWADWVTSFDDLGWSRCHLKEYVRGFYRNNYSPPSDPIYLLENARCCKAPYPYENTPQTCQIAYWWGTLDG